MNKIYVLGVGPGSPEYILPIIHRKAAECQVLVGGKRNLELFHALGKQELYIKSNIAEIIEKIKELAATEQVGVLVSGDPGFYSFLTSLLRHFSREELEVYPGIGSLQYLFAKGALPWQDAELTSLHGRRIEDLEELIRTKSKVAFLTDPRFPAGEIAAYLVSRGIQGKRALIGENLSYPEEKIYDLSLEKCIGLEVANLCVMVIYDDK